LNTEAPLQDIVGKNFTSPRTANEESKQGLSGHVEEGPPRSPLKTWPERDRKRRLGCGPSKGVSETSPNLHFWRGAEPTEDE